MKTNWKTKTSKPRPVPLLVIREAPFGTRCRRFQKHPKSTKLRTKMDFLILNYKLRIEILFNSELMWSCCFWSSLLVVVRGGMFSRRYIVDWSNMIQLHVLANSTVRAWMHQRPRSRDVYKPMLFRLDINTVKSFTTFSFNFAAHIFFHFFQCTHLSWYAFEVISFTVWKTCPEMNWHVCVVWGNSWRTWKQKKPKKSRKRSQKLSLPSRIYIDFRALNNLNRFCVLWHFSSWSFHVWKPRDNVHLVFSPIHLLYCYLIRVLFCYKV